MKRLFVVGCSRSGTSLIQKELSRLTGFYTLPETAFFDKPSTSKTERQERIVELLSLSGSICAKELEKLTIDEIVSFLKMIQIDISKYLEYGANGPKIFSQLMDFFARFNGASGWIEKTPKHFKGIDFILSNIKNAKCIYVFRNGVDVVASLRDRALKYECFAEQSNVAYGANLWNQSVNKFAEVINIGNLQTRIYPLKFEDVVAESSNLQKALEYFSITFDCTRDDSFSVTTEGEGWKSGLSNTIKMPVSKSKKLLSTEEENWLEKNLNADLLETTIKRHFSRNLCDP